MNLNLTYLAIIEIFCSLTTGVAILFITYKLLLLFANRKIGLTESNTSFRLFSAGVLFAVGHMISGVIQPILTSFRVLNSQPHSSLILTFLLYSTIYVMIAFVASLITSLVGISFYRYLTSIDEFKEIKNDNIGVAIITSTIIIILSMMTKDGVVFLLSP